MSFFLIIFEPNLFKYEKNKKKLAQLQFLIFFILCMHMHTYVCMRMGIYIIKIFILLRTSDIIFSIYNRAISFNFNNYFIFCYSQNQIGLVKSSNVGSYKTYFPKC